MKERMRRPCAGVAAAFGLLALGATAPAQQKSETSITRQHGILYLPAHVVGKQQLIEKHAEWGLQS